MPKNTKRRLANELARDRRRIADLYLKGWLQADIADELQLSQTTISRDLKTMQGKWIAAALIDFNQAKGNEIAKIDRLEREHWAAWERSCLDAETITKKGRGKKGSDKPESIEEIHQRKGQAGDSRFLAGIQWCIDRRIKLFGLDEPDRIVVDWRQEVEEAGIDASDVFEQLVAVAAEALAEGQG